MHERHCRTAGSPGRCCRHYRGCCAGGRVPAASAVGHACDGGERALDRGARGLHGIGGVAGFAAFAMALLSLVFVFGLDYSEVFIFPNLATEFPAVVARYGDGTMMPSVAFAIPARASCSCSGSRSSGGSCIARAPSAGVPRCS